MNYAKAMTIFCKRPALAALLCALSLSCGKDGDNRTGVLKYYLEQAATSTITNTLVLEVDGGEFKPSFSLSGDGFTADIPFNSKKPFTARTELKAETFGDTAVVLTLYQENGKPYLTDTLLWKSSGEVPPKPEPYFSELASADPYVYLVLPADRGTNTKEVYVEGDLAPGFATGSYYTIPADDQVLLELSPGDGLKTIRMKYRNIFGAHSEVVELSIPKKAQGPENCKAIPVALKTATGSIRTRIQADNIGPLFYRVTGDVSTVRDYIEFTGSIEEYIGLIGAQGRKNITVKIKDAAGNACPDIKVAIDYDTTYVPASLSIEGNPLWTDSPDVFILPRFDQLIGDVIEMQVSGNVLATANTFQWLPYTERLPITLSPTSGTRHVIVEFRKNGAIVGEVTKSVFLRPYVLVTGSAPNQRVVPGNILGAVNLSITGCAEVYSHVAYEADYDCTKVGTEAIVTYYFADGSTVTRAAPL
jgi:hypothetical protein